MAAMGSMGHAWTPPTKIIIAGGGLHGSALAYYLTKAGHKDVTVVDRRAISFRNDASYLDDARVLPLSALVFIFSSSARTKS